jgi:iron complex outermembrane recepter protein
MFRKQVLFASGVARISLCTLFTSLPVFVQAQSATLRFDIPAEELGTALREFGRAAKQQIAFDEASVRGKSSSALNAELTIDEALQRLLSGSGLHATRRSSGVIVVEQDSAPMSMGAAAAKLEEVVVTAQKREERLQDVPAAVSVLNTDTLTQTGQIQLRDYYDKVPGLNLSSGFYGLQNVVIRGITTGPGSPSVAITVDGVPFGGSTSDTGGQQLPDIDPSDLARIEVLRGPQGALYGADSLGGVVNYVTKDPSFDAFSGSIQTGLSSSYNGAQLGYNVHGAVNIPLTTTLAARVSGYSEQIPGYVDDPRYSIQGANRGEVDGARLSLLWRPSEALSLKLGAIYGYSKYDAASEIDVTAGLSGLQQNYLPNSSGNTQSIQNYSADLNWEVGGVHLKSLTGYNVNKPQGSIDFSSVVGSTVGNLPGYTGDDGIVYKNELTIEKLSQEIRIGGALSARSDWQVGGYYTRESEDRSNPAFAANLTTGQTLGRVYLGVNTSSFDEYSIFGNFTYRATEQFDVLIGGRESWVRLKVSDQFLTGPIAAVFDGSDPTTLPGSRSQGDAFSYLLTPRLKITPDLVVYVRLASGYRPGQGNAVHPGDIPAFTSPDKTKNYELGLKGDWLDHKLNADLSLFYIDWTGIPLSLFDQQLLAGYDENGGKAKSAGVEFSLSAKPWHGGTVGGWVDYDDAVLTSPFPASATVYGASGDRLPFSAQWSWHAFAQQDLTVSEGLSGFVAGEVGTIGDRYGIFTGSPGAPAPRQFLPSYTKLDLRAGLKSDGWTLSVYSNNVTNSHGLIDGGIGYPLSFAYLEIRSRLTGLNITKTF